MTALDPVYTIGEQIAETVMRHEGCSRSDAMARALELLQAREGALARAPAAGLSARTLRRPAPARHDRDRALLPPEPAARRRADHRARRHGADPGADPAAQAAAGVRHGRDLRHPRSRRRGADRRQGRGDVCRPHRRIRQRARRAAALRAIPTRSGMLASTVHGQNREQRYRGDPRQPARPAARCRRAAAFAPRCKFATAACAGEVPPPLAMPTGTNVSPACTPARSPPRLTRQPSPELHDPRPNRRSSHA